MSEIIGNRSVPTEIVIPGLDNGDNASDTSCVKGRERFKAITKKVISARRLISAEQISSVGQDPGIDPRDVNVDYDVHNPCKIFCADFSNDCVRQSEGLTNDSIEAFLQKERPSGTKVRWINVDGISWDVIKTLSMHYDLHPLAIEDTLQGNQRTKMDQYQNHIYISLLLHTLFNNHHEEDLRKWNSCKDLLHLNHRGNSTYLEAHKVLRKDKLYINVEQVNIFLLANDVLITIFQYSGRSVYTPILARINQAKTLLRSSQEASLLMEAVIDAIVDLAIPIKDSYQHQIAELEGKLLIRPKMEYTRELHMISRELTILKRTLGPIQGLVTLLREHSDQKHLISPLAKIYFMDVSDHCLEIVDDLYTMTKITDSCVDMIFNMVAYETNESMRIIAIFSIVFLPMTFIAGFFGMNFKNFEQLDYPLSYFWWVTGFSTAGMLILGTYSIWTKWILRFFRYVCRRKKIRI